MFERLQKPFLTVETGEAYQPIRLAYNVSQKDTLIEVLNKLKCCEKNASGNTWNWFWRDECDELHFESLETFKKNPQHPLRLGTITIRDDSLYFNLPSFKRACLAVPFFDVLITQPNNQSSNQSIAKVDHADFINKVFGIDERLPHGFTELFKEDELQSIVEQRIAEYDKTQQLVEDAASPDEAFKILSEYTKREASKRLPYAERYSFAENDADEADVAFLGFYIFLRSRELVAIRRWFGETGYTLSNAAEEAVQQVFGEMDIDIIE